MAKEDLREEGNRSSPHATCSYGDAGSVVLAGAFHRCRSLKGLHLAIFGRRVILGLKCRAFSPHNVMDWACHSAQGYSQVTGTSEVPVTWYYGRS